MKKELLTQLSMLTSEEKELLNGHQTIDRSIYYAPEKGDNNSVIDHKRILTDGKLIDIRPHTRFVHFPKHTHNYIEFVYMCAGSTKHLIDEQPITLMEGDLLFMNQHAAQEIFPASKDDIAVNFMIRPEFFDEVLPKLTGDRNPLRDFLISCLTDRDMGGNYLYFSVHGLLPVQNLMENLIWLMLKDPERKRILAQQSMALLFEHLVSNDINISLPENSYEQELMIKLLSYIETEYKNAALSDFIEKNSVDIYTMGRIIKKNTGKTFKDLLMEKRMKTAGYLLKNTDLSTVDISFNVGYENTSYFHRLFKETYGMSPRNYRLA
ncbi:MAG: helix-turn-helix domain-containing protein [Oribacterium sp.]|nr:helix-turn-helix domain-containing protein [Oribacterium sp.]